MICESTVKTFCCEDINLIENYQKAIISDTTWECHHRLEIDENKSKQQLIDEDRYYNRPANELIFLTKAEHRSIHMTGRPRPYQGPLTSEHRQHISESNKGKEPWNKGKHNVQDYSNRKPSSRKDWHPSEESKEKNRLAHLGKTPWNKGLRKGQKIELEIV